MADIINLPPRPAPTGDQALLCGLYDTFLSILNEAEKPERVRAYVVAALDMIDGEAA